MLREQPIRRERSVRIAVLVALVVAIALLHFVIPTTSHGWHELHIVLRKLYFLPPVVAAVWFGLGGAIWTTLAVSGLFMTHAVLDWPGNYMEQANQSGELLGFWVVALLAGYLFDRQRTLLEGVATAHEETVDGLVTALDLREHNTGMHSHRVREYTLLLADRLGVDRRLRHHIAYGALLHDIGKIAVPDHILLKPGRLTDEEWVEIRKHPGVGYGIVRRVSFLQEAAEIVHAHHEHFDGRGYPRGLQRKDIPLGARLFAVADVYDALTSERPYRSPMTYAEAVAEIRAGEGTQFDPAVVAAFVEVSRADLEAVAVRWHDAAEAVPSTEREAASPAAVTGVL